VGLKRLVPERLRPAPSVANLRQRFFDRYAGCTLILHQGFPEGWLGKLVHEPGGGGHFRIDVRQPAYSGRPPRRPAPVQWLVREHVLPLGLPLPLLIRVEDRDHLRVRHLRRHGGICQPEEVGMIYEDMAARPHALLLPEDDGFAVDWGIDVEDNMLDTPYGMI
jgi:hypothetical protein